MSKLIKKNEIFVSIQFLDTARVIVREKGKEPQHYVMVASDELALSVVAPSRYELLIQIFRDISKKLLK